MCYRRNVTGFVLFTVALLYGITLAVPDALAQDGQSSSSSHYDWEPWEPEDLLSEAREDTALLNPLRLPRWVALDLIHWYRRDIAPNSIARCPFDPSCSVFAEHAIRSYGLLVGLCMFIDRNFYRENPQVYQLYDLIEIAPGELKLDDRWYLELGGGH